MRSFTSNENFGKTILLITDGENHEDDPVKAAATAAEKGVNVNIVGIGLSKGAPIPFDNGNDYMRDGNGNIVITQLNEQMCQEITAAGKGKYLFF